MYHETRSVYSDIHLPTKNNITTPRPITDSKLKRTLNKDGDLAKLSVTPQDEKILALMVKRGEWERKYWKKKLKNAVAWDKEKTASDEYRADTAREHRNSVESHREDDRQSLKLRKIAREKKRQEKRRQLEIELQKENIKTNKLLTEQQKLKEMSESPTNLKHEKEQTHNIGITRQHKCKVNQPNNKVKLQRKREEKQLKEKKEKEEKDKENQVKNWWDVNSKEYEKKYNDHLEHDKKRLHAGVKREEMIHDEKERIAKENETERMTFTERYVDYRRKLENSTHNLHIRLDRRLHTAEVNYEKQKKKREEKIKGDALEEQFKLEHAIKTQHKQAKKRQKITKNLWKKDEKKIVHANESLMSSLEKTAQHIREERQKHEEEQKKNLKLVRKKANAWKKKLRKDIKARDEKILQLQSDRVSVMETSRSVANDSRLLRNKVLDKYGSESFDKKLFRVQRFHSLGTRPSTQDWNSSTISLL